MYEALSNFRGMRALCVALLVAGWYAAPASAADAMHTTMVAIGSPAAPLAAAARGAGERVVFTGRATVKSRLARDPDFGESKLLLFIDMRAVSGVGASSGARYVIPSQEILLRPLTVSHQVELTFPFAEKATDPLSLTRTGVASFSLNVDINTGAVTAASGTAASR